LACWSGRLAGGTLPETVRSIRTMVGQEAVSAIRIVRRILLVIIRLHCDNRRFPGLGQTSFSTGRDGRNEVVCLYEK